MGTFKDKASGWLLGLGGVLIVAFIIGGIELRIRQSSFEATYRADRVQDEKALQLFQSSILGDLEELKTLVGTLTSELAGRPRYDALQAAEDKRQQSILDAIQDQRDLQAAEYLARSAESLNELEKRVRTNEQAIIKLQPKKSSE